MDFVKVFCFFVFRFFMMISSCFSQCSLCTVSIVMSVLSEFAFVCFFFDSTRSSFSCVALWQTKQFQLFWLKTEFMCHENTSW